MAKSTRPAGILLVTIGSGVHLAALLGSLLLGSACASLEAYSRRVARKECASLYRCSVYDDRGLHTEPCFAAAGRKYTVYASDPGWPFERGVCPAVESETSLTRTGP
jgi:hypothetical protein